MTDQCDLPTERDFDPSGGDLDAQSAWKNFGGLTLDQAHIRFREAPEAYQEDFMWMGGKAFAFYYPVIDRYLRETAERPPAADDDRQAWILANCIRQQFYDWNLQFVAPLQARVQDLARFVRGNLSLFAQTEDEQQNLDEQWSHLEMYLERHRDDPFNLVRFIDAQESSYELALVQLRLERKTSHWMWYVFPQLLGLGLGSMAQTYAITCLDEAQAYLAHPLLGPRLVECCEALLAIHGKSALEILGSPDDLKLKSSMTLFAQLPGAPTQFSQVLDKYYSGQQDQRTLELLKSAGD